MALSIDPPSTLKIISIDDGTVVEAQFNPKELQVDKSVPWSKHKDSKSEAPHLEFTGAEPMSMAFELLFDGAETGIDVQLKINDLLKLARIIDFDVVEKKRPHRVVVIWGTGRTKEAVSPSLLPFEGVIESVSTKYQMFSKDGAALRATCNVKLKQASQASFKKK